MEEEKPFKGISLSNLKVKTARAVECTVQNVELRQSGVVLKSLSQGAKATAVLKANMPLKGGKAVLRNAAALRQ